MEFGSNDAPSADYMTGHIFQNPNEDDDRVVPEIPTDGFGIRANRFGQSTPELDEHSIPLGFSAEDITDQSFQNRNEDSNQVVPEIPTEDIGIQAERSGQSARASIPLDVSAVYMTGRAFQDPDEDGDQIVPEIRAHSTEKQADLSGQSQSTRAPDGRSTPFYIKLEELDVMFNAQSASVANQSYIGYQNPGQLPYSTLQDSEMVIAYADIADYQNEVETDEIDLNGENPEGTGDQLTGFGNFDELIYDFI